MREMQAASVEAELPHILDDVERGDTVIILRHGRAIARIVPEPHRPASDVEQAMADIRTLRTRTGRITAEELLSAREEGRRF